MTLRQASINSLTLCCTNWLYLLSRVSLQSECEVNDPAWQVGTANVPDRSSKSNLLHLLQWYQNALSSIPQAVLDQSGSAMREFLSRLPEGADEAQLEMRPLAEQATFLEHKDEGFVVPTQVRAFAFGRGGHFISPS